jgi:hypothetical protein
MADALPHQTLRLSFDEDTGIAYLQIEDTGKIIEMEVVKD